MKQISLKLTITVEEVDCRKVGHFLAHSISLCNRAAYVVRLSVGLSVRPSVRPSVNFYANRFFYQTNDWIAIKLTQHGPHTGLHPGCAQGQCQCQRSRDTDTFLISRKSLILAGADGWIATKHAHDGPQNSLHQGCARGQGQDQRSRDTDTLNLCFHENRFLSQANGWNANKLAHGRYTGCAQGQGGGQRSCETGTSVTSRNVCYTVPSDVLSLHAITLRSTTTLSFQYNCKAARYM